MSHIQLLAYSITLIVLLFLAAFFAAAETGLMAINRYRLRHQARMKKRYAMRLLKLLKRPDRLLGAILIGSTFANMFASSLVTLLAFHFWGDHGALLAAILLTIVVLIFAEIMPKTVAAIYPDRIARLVAYPIQYVLLALYPAVWVANIITNGLLRILRVRITQHSVEPLSREELRSVVYDTEGKISRQYQNMLLTILDLSKLTVDDIMIPSHEIVGFDLDQPLNDVLQQLNNFRAEWVPIYRTNVNNLVGVLYMRDVMRLLLAGGKLTKDIIEQFLQEPYFIPEGTALNVQLASFQHSAHKVGFIVDEYGEILGILTLNDILEEIVGDMHATLTSAKRIQAQEDGSYIVEGAVTVREFNRATDWELPTTGPRTITGLIIEKLEALPHAKSGLLINHHPIEILQVKDNRVKNARIYPKRQHD